MSSEQMTTVTFPSWGEHPLLASPTSFTTETSRAFLANFAELRRAAMLLDLAYDEAMAT